MPPAVKTKSTRNPGRTRQRLLDAGVNLFSLRGYDGVSVDEIVKQAGCNKRMLYHYFGNKESLYIEVLRAVFGKLEAWELETLTEPPDAEAAIRQILARYFDFLQENPEFVNLLMWENLHQGRFLDAHPQLLSKSPVVELLNAIVEREKERGGISQGTDTRHLLVTLIGACFIYFSNRYTLRHTVGLACERPAVLRRGLETAQDIILHGLLRKA